MGTTLTNFTSPVWMFEWACFPSFVISWYAQWSFDHCLHHHLFYKLFHFKHCHLGADSILWRRFKTILQLLNNKLSKNISTNHEILTVPSFQHNFILYRNDINIFVSRISHWTQYSGYSWYFLCFSWNTNMKHQSYLYETDFTPSPSQNYHS